MMWIVGKIAYLFGHNPRTSADKLDKDGRGVAHDLTNIAARVDMLARLQREMKDPLEEMVDRMKRYQRDG